ncbi:unnamed protein product, partial [Lymnaea stagnalis]
MSQSYNGCEVTEIKNVADVPGCQCVWSNEGSLLVNYQLYFNGTHDKDRVRWTVQDVIYHGATKHYVGAMAYVLIKDFLVDIKANWKQDFDGIEADLTIPVFNLNHTAGLKDRLSKDFIDLAAPFCNDVGQILTRRSISSFADRYYSCEVRGFSSRPDRITFQVHLTGQQWRSVQKTLPY